MSANLGNLFRLLTALTPSILQFVENTYVHSKAGTQKFDTAVQLVTVAAAVLAPTIGVPADQLPSPDAIGGHVETVLANMKATGALIPANLQQASQSQGAQ